MLFGAAYYHEYMPYERLDADIELMKKANINVVRIAESTWSTLEPLPGEFDFTHIDRVTDAMGVAGISVIIGTPTYAVPAWLVKMDPTVLVETKAGRARYGHRQLMDITNSTFLERAEQVCRALLSHTAGHPAVIGFQVDNETKHYGVTGELVQKRFVQHLKQKFGTVQKLNETFGLAYWSNALGSWEDFPDIQGCVHGGLACEFAAFQRSLVSEYLAWQVGLVDEYRRKDQFVTHNFDFAWKKFGADIAQDGYSYGIQPDVDHWQASQPFDLAGTDIYHPTQDGLTGAETAFGGDLIRALKKKPYLVLETQAQAFNSWLPYPEQLRLHAYGHFAAGAMGLMYWNWHSIHNGYETYWRGLLGHDLQPNPTYEEAAALGRELREFGDKIQIQRKNNRVAVVVDNRSLSLLNWFPVHRDLRYNDIFRWVYDTMYRMNLECDVVFADALDASAYDMLVLPALYSVSEELLYRLKAWVENGGTLITTYKTAVSNEYGSVYPDTQPHILHECLALRYNQFTIPGKTTLCSHMTGSKEIAYFMELLQPSGAEVLAGYEGSPWAGNAAITRHRYGQGSAFHVGCHCDCTILDQVLRLAAKAAGIDVPAIEWPVVIRQGINSQSERILYYLNYSDTEKQIEIAGKYNIILGEKFKTKEDVVILKPWGATVLQFP